MTLDDMASNKEQMDRDIALANQQAAASRFKLLATGECLSCGDTDLPTSDALHCGDPDCVARVEVVLKQRARGMR